MLYVISYHTSSESSVQIYRLIIIDNSHRLRKATLTFSSSDDVKTEHLCSAVMTLKAIFM